MVVHFLEVKLEIRGENWNYRNWTENLKSEREKRNGYKYTKYYQLLRKRAVHSKWTRKCAICTVKWWRWDNWLTEKWTHDSTLIRRRHKSICFLSLIDTVGHTCLTKASSLWGNYFAEDNRYRWISRKKIGDWWIMERKKDRSSATSAKRCLLQLVIHVFGIHRAFLWSGYIAKTLPYLILIVPLRLPFHKRYRYISKINPKIPVLQNFKNT